MACGTLGGLDFTPRRPEPRHWPPTAHVQEGGTHGCVSPNSRKVASFPPLQPAQRGLCPPDVWPLCSQLLGGAPGDNQRPAVLDAPLGAGRGPEESARPPAPAHLALLPRCACIDVRHAHKASRRWTLEMDVALVQYVNRLCRHLAITPARLHPHEVYLDPADATDPRVACLLSMWP